MHTEGKLKRKDFWLDLDEDRNPPISIGAVCKVEISDEEAIANADRIVLCWNSHDKLLAACEIGRAYIEAQITGVPRPIGDLQEDKTQVDAAIAEAKGA